MPLLQLERGTKLLELLPGQYLSGSLPEPDYEPLTATDGLRYTPPNPPISPNDSFDNPFPLDEMRDILKELLYRVQKGPKSISLTLKEAYSLREALLTYFKNYDLDKYTEIREELYG